LNKLLFPLLLLIGSVVVAQPVSNTTANAHSHNDYEQPVPLYASYNEMFGSIEADIFWHKGKLLVAHKAEELQSARTLEKLYLKPLEKFIKKNKGHIYADTTRRLQFMIDLKTNGDTTLPELVKLLQKYPAITKCTSLKITISGSRPEVTPYAAFPSFIWFDGELQQEYPADMLARIVMLSSDMKKFTEWNGTGEIPAEQRNNLQQAIDRAHVLGKTVRFWGAPDNENTWKQLMGLKVDYINTDSIKALSAYFGKLKQ
jgi:alkaline phosphatase